ncbi:MAG TPA: hypothetical protein VLA80_07880, partial [Actinomycetota bacterium]|nr:hypothetical protein [Actinomycetota bacterium]
VGRMLAAGLVMFVVVVLVDRAAGAMLGPWLGRDLMTVVAGVAAGAGTYLAAARLLRVEELGLLLDIVRRRRGGAGGLKASPGGWGTRPSPS